MGSSEVSASRFWESLPARPPTPPREANHDPEPISKDIVLRQTADPRSSLHTPPNVYPSDASTSNSTNPSSRRGPKRVGFSAQAEYKEPPRFPAAGDSAVRRLSPLSAPSSTQPKPVKGILKPSCSPNPLDSLLGPNSNGVTESVNIAAMLESTIQQLAGSDRDSKLDAYMMLVRALRISDNLPDRIALQDKMTLLTQFIQRDITTVVSDSHFDSSLANHALTLLSTLLHYYSAVASSIPNEFGIFIVDHSIKAFNDRETPKDMVRHLMQALSVQNFRPEVMTSNRVGRLVKSLHELEEHVSGKSIIKLRIQIYRRLVRQAKQPMSLHLDWLSDLFTDMLSSIGDIRSTAIELGFEAARALGKDKNVPRKVAELLAVALEDMRYIEYYIDRLGAMVKDRQDSAVVPRIWSVVVLFFRSPFPIERWDYFSHWLRLLQSCFNSGDMPTKQEANYAWNRFVYVLHTHEGTFTKLFVTLCQPVDSLLKRKSVGKQATSFRNVVIGSICNLYYYTFKPSVIPSRLDTYWDCGVKPFMIQLATADRGPEAQEEQISQACAILTGLFDSSTPRIWKEDRVLDSPLAEPAELPGINSKWLRRNSLRTFAVIEPILQRAVLDLGNKKSSVHKLWATLVRSIASAASKEIKVSLDTTTFVAHMFALLLKLWTQGVPASAEGQSDAPDRFLRSIQEYIQVVVDALGPLPFTEKLITMSKQNTFVPVAVPSHRPSLTLGITKSPLHHLFSILSTLPPGVADDSDFYIFLRTAFKPFFAGRSVQAKSDLAQEMLRALPMQTQLPYGPWLLVRDHVHDWLVKHPQTPTSASSASSEAPIGHELREVVKILERGLVSTPNLAATHWTSLFADLASRTWEETGDAGKAIAVIEPLAKTALEHLNNREREELVPAKLLSAATAMFSEATQPRDRHAVDAARRRLWGASIPGPKAGSFDTFDNLYKLSNAMLTRLYEDLQFYDVDEDVSPLLSEVEMFLGRCQPQTLSRTLSNLQDGLTPWVQDEKSQLRSRQKSAGAEAAKVLWDGVCKALSSLERPENVQLDLIEDLLCAAFESKHRYVVNSVSVMWNGIFDNASAVTYPEKLKAILLSIRPSVDIILPGLEVSSVESGAQQHSFVESQDDLALLNVSSTKSDRREHTSAPSPYRESASPAPVQIVLPKNVGVEVHIPAQRRTTPRLRHDDSQIQFAPVESSPAYEPLESQLLTEHQKEVRDRQKENAAMFSDIQSSPAARPRSSSRKSKSRSPPTSPIPKAVPEKRRETTPEADPYEDVFSSTPTPRRGQAIAMEDHEMTDPPSSPPDPRRHLLLSEMKSRSSSNSSKIDIDWEISSSPISGSPVPSRQVLSNNEPPELNLLDESTQTGNSRKAGLPAEEVEEGSFAMEVIPSSIPTKSQQDVAQDAEAGEFPPEEVPETQQPLSAAAARLLAPGPTRAQRPATRSRDAPKSELEIRIDASTSPGPPSVAAHLSNEAGPAAGDTADASFTVSDGDERSMLRLVVEIDAKSNVPGSKLTRVDGEELILDCITVRGPDLDSPVKTEAVIKSLSSAIPSTEDDDQSAVAGAAETAGRKRKRGGSRLWGRPKRRRTLSRSDKASQEEDGLDSQASASTNAEKAETRSRKLEAVPDTERASPGSELRGSSGNEPSQSQAQDAAAAVDSPQPSSLVELMPRDGSDTDEELESQLVEEQAAFSRSQSRQCEVPVAPEAVETSVDVEMEEPAAEVETADEPEATTAGELAQPAAEPEADQLEDVQLGSVQFESVQLESVQPEGVQPSAEESALGTEDQGGVEDIMATLRGGMDKLRGVALSREDVYKIEDMFMDLKRELYEAERRGRQ